MKNHILNYLQSDRSFESGLKLYMQHGKSLSFKTSLNRQGYTKYNHDLLLEELRKIAGITAQEFKLLISKPIAPAEVADPEITVDNTPLSYEEKVVSIRLIPDQVRKSIRLRDDFPFLAQPNCPDEFKILVHDMINAYSNYVDGHAKLFEAITGEELQEIASQVVENYIENREIWDELNFYKANGKILGKHPIFATTERMLEIRNMSTADHVKLQNNLKSNISKTKKLVETDPEHKNTAARKQSIAKWEVELEVVKGILGLDA